MSICCHGADFSVLTGLFAVLGRPTECQRKSKAREGFAGVVMVVVAGGTDRWMMGWKGGGVTVPRRAKSRGGSGVGRLLEV